MSFQGSARGRSKGARQSQHADEVIDLQAEGAGGQDDTLGGFWPLADSVAARARDPGCDRPRGALALMSRMMSSSDSTSGPQ